MTNEELAAAMGIDPSPANHRTEAAQRGRKLVSDAMQAIEAAQHKADRVAALRVLLHADHINDVRACLFAESTWFKAQWMTLSGFGMKGDGQQALKIIRGSSSRSASPFSADDAPDGLHMPPGYHVDPAGVCLIGPEGERIYVTSAPVYVSAIARDVEQDGVSLELRWRGDDGWASHTVDRFVAADARSLVRLASDGMPVHSGNATELVKYLAAFEAYNQAALPRINISRHMGWAGEAFLWGTDDLTAGSGPGVTLAGNPAMMARAEPYREGGTWEGWTDAVRRLVCPSPSVMLALYASACAPLLRILDADGFVVDWSGETSQGKTTALRVAASVWGVPKRDTGIIGSWSAPSTVGATVRAWFSQSMPVLLDDTKEGRDDVVAALLYMIPAGREGDKGAADGSLRQARTWRTVLLSTGESPITSRSQDGGARARTLCIEGSPVKTGEQAIQIAEAMGQHHGHLGPRVVRYAIDHADQLRAAYEAHRAQYRADAQSAVQGRAAAYVAALRVAAEVCTAVGCPVPDRDPLDLAVQAAADAGVSADRPKEAMAALLTWCASHEAEFYGRTHEQPHSGWAGVWQPGRSPIGLDEAVIARVLHASGYRLAEVLHAWQSRGWMESNPGKTKKRMRMGSSSPWLLCVSADIVDDFMGG